MATSSQHGARACTPPTPTHLRAPRPPRARCHLPRLPPCRRPAAHAKKAVIHGPRRSRSHPDIPSASRCGSVAGSTLVCTSAYGVPDGPRRVSACKGVPMNRLGGRGGHLVTFDPGPPGPPGHQAQSASLVTRCPPGARSLTRALEIGFFALLLPHGWHLRDGRRGGRAGTARASPNEPSSVSYRSRSVPLSGRRRRLGARWAAHDAARRVPARHCQDRARCQCCGRCGRHALDRILCLPAPVPFRALEPGVYASHASHSRHSNCALGAALCSVR